MQHHDVTRTVCACWLIALLSSLAGCIGFVGPEVAAPEMLGTYPVGVTTLTVHDPDRERSLPVELWYPATDAPTAEDEEPVVYQVLGMGGTVARIHSPAGARRDVGVTKVGGPFPVVLMSHGAGSTRYGSATLAEVLASRGYIVAAPDHVGHTIEDYFFGIDDTERAQSAYDRPRDLSRVLDALQARAEDPTFVVGGRLDTSRVAVAGHSFGGLAALGMVGASFDGARQLEECREDDSHRSCAAVPIFGAKPYRYRDPRVRAAILITPAGFDLYRADGIATADAPALVVGAKGDFTTPFGEYAKPTSEALTSAHYLLELPAGHLTATDCCRVIDSIGFLAKTFGGPRATDGCGGEPEGMLTSEEANERVARAALAFLELHLAGDASAEERLMAALVPPEEPSRAPTNVARR